MSDDPHASRVDLTEEAAAQVHAGWGPPLVTGDPEAGGSADAAVHPLVLPAKAWPQPTSAIQPGQSRFTAPAPQQPPVARGDSAETDAFDALPEPEARVAVVPDWSAPLPQSRVEGPASVEEPVEEPVVEAPVTAGSMAEAPVAAPEVAAPEVDAPEVAVPEGALDLTEEPISTTVDATLPTAAAVAGTALDHGEPQAGNVEVNTPVTTSDSTVILPSDTALSDQRAARARALGQVDPGADVVAAPAKLGPPSVYRGWPSFVLFVFRLLVAGILAVRATEALVHFSNVRDTWAASPLPQPTLVTLVEIVVFYLVALMLVLGLGTRVAGLLILVSFVAILTFLVWGTGNPFSPFSNGFQGEFDLLMAGVGLMFMGIGGGGAAVDAAVHRSRLERKNSQAGVA